MLELRSIALTVLAPLDPWAHQCHQASVKLVRSDAFRAVAGPCRVARGGCEGVGSQHSWVVLGMDCYAEDAIIVDPTLWSYDQDVHGVWVGRSDDRHIPHGRGSIWSWGRPGEPTGPVIGLTPSEPLSQAAQGFLEILGPLDYEGWRVLGLAPVGGWPSGEIFAAMADTEELRQIVSIDILGMTTDRNPQRLYLP